MNTRTPIVVIPVYNHASTLLDVVKGVLQHSLPLVVVDDGSTDGSTTNLEQVVDNNLLHIVRFSKNRGKGAAVKAGAELARGMGGTHIIAIDADGQHYPEDMSLFLKAIAQEPNAIILGARNFSGPNIPGSTRFGRKFSSFWMLVQTGLSISEMQCGYRAYPITVFESVHTGEDGYAFDVEIIVRAAWAGFPITEIPVRVYYPPKKERISHFDFLRDNIKISILNTRLTIRALAPLPFVRAAEAQSISWRRPLTSLACLLKKATPWTLAYSAGISMAISTLPLPGLQTILLLLAIGRLKLDRCCALAMMPLTWPPFVPGLGVLLGYRVRRGEWLDEFSIRTLGYEAPQRLLDWVVGATFLAPLLGFLSGCLVFCCASALLRRLLHAQE